MFKYGLIGYPLKHSFSQKFFSAKFELEHIDAHYFNFEISDVSLFPSIIDSHPELRGLNVTIPYKEQIIPFLDELSLEAREIGAINVVRIDRSSGKARLIGYNSDIVGFQNSICPLVDRSVHQKALILGTGGASKAVRRGLENLGLEIKFVSRVAKEDILSYADITKDILSEYTVIVNSTPLGTFPDVDNAPSIPYELLTSSHLLYDLVYNPAETKFLRLGRENGAKIKNGAEMLELQALAAWDIWNE